MKEFQVPILDTGAIARYKDQARIVEWRDNEPFHAKMRFLGFERGRSAAHAVYQDVETTQTHIVFLTDIATMIRFGEPLDEVSGEWIVVKRGQSYGIQMTGAQ